MTSQKLKPFIHQGTRQPDFYTDQTDTLYFKKGFDGRKIKFSCRLKSKDFVKAKRFANSKFNQLINKNKVILKTLIKDELKSWLTVKESEGHKYDTLNNIRRAKKQIEAFWGDKFPSEITQDNLTAWYAWWKEHEPEIDMENAIKYMRNFCRYLGQKFENGRPLLPVLLPIKDPNAKTIRRRRKKAKENIFTLSDFKKILSTAQTERDRLIVLIMYTMATRITETLEMSFESEIVKEKGQWRYQWSDGQNKADLDGWHSLHPAVATRVSTLWGERNRGTDRLFPQQQDRTKAIREQMIDWGAWRKRAGLAFHWTPHTFRHTCLSNLFNDPANPQALICKLYRVSLAVAMDTYIKPTEEGRERMARAIKVEI